MQIRDSKLYSVFVDASDYKTIETLCNNSKCPEGSGFICPKRIKPLGVIMLKRGPKEIAVMYDMFTEKGIVF